VITRVAPEVVPPTGRAWPRTRAGWLLAALVGAAVVRGAAPAVDGALERAAGVRGALERAVVAGARLGADVDGGLLDRAVLTALAAACGGAGRHARPTGLDSLGIE
jgi:hypothetical protein